jgi:hypothetical protein
MIDGKSNEPEGHSIQFSEDEDELTEEELCNRELDAEQFAFEILAGFSPSQPRDSHGMWSAATEHAELHHTVLNSLARLTTHESKTVRNVAKAALKASKIGFHAKAMAAHTALQAHFAAGGKGKKGPMLQKAKDAVGLSAADILNENIKLQERIAQLEAKHDAAEKAAIIAQLKADNRVTPVTLGFIESLSNSLSLEDFAKHCSKLPKHLPTKHPTDEGPVQTLTNDELTTETLTAGHESCIGMLSSTGVRYKGEAITPKLFVEQGNRIMRLVNRIATKERQRGENLAAAFIKGAR